MSNIDVKSEFSEFGKKMKIVGIMTILVIIPYVGSFLSFIGFIFGIMALGDIRNANNKLNQSSLENYRSKYISAIVIRIISTAISAIGSFYTSNWILDFVFTFNLSAIIGSAVILIITFVLNIIAAAIEMDAWRSLTDFFNQNRTLFPQHIATEAADGSDKLRSAALMNILSFLIITILIGWIFQIIGYFKLAKLEEITRYSDTTPTTSIPIEEVAPHPTTPPSELKFCPNCGSKVSGEGKYCMECGSELK
ncbi:MAG: zinc ribbon domain-containing protein [Candidatus Lokiarchaeota archaeon]|nr:zinc ribbon domain-containing protein [Candidatus Lokiarchaeota archaeon]